MVALVYSPGMSESTQDEGDHPRTRPHVTITLDPANLSWLRSWASDLPLSRKVDAAVTLMREQLGGD